MTNTAHKSRRSPRSPEFWQDTVASWRRSGLSGAAFAEEHGLAAHSLYRWGLRLRKQDDARVLETTGPGAAQFVPVEVVNRKLGRGAEGMGYGDLEIAWPSGPVIRLHGSACPEVLAAVIRTVAEVTPC